MDMLDKWHDFFLILGAAAGTLIGSMFVVVSIASGMIRGGELTSRIFVTPTIIHLAVVLMSCALVLVPTLTRWARRRGRNGGMFPRLCRPQCLPYQQRRAVEWSDYLWYGLDPLFAYLVMMAAGCCCLNRPAGRSRPSPCRWRCS